MSKALNPLSVAEGKLGNLVYYKLKNSATGQRQGIREYVANPSNPQTDGQLAQRVKMTAVVNCYRAFREVIQRSFEGTEYGQPSYNRWASLAMGKQFQGPYLVKDDRRPCPVLGVPMSIGSLPQITGRVSIANSSSVYTNLFIGAGADLSTVGSLSQALLSYNDFLQLGDQLTVCVVSRTPDQQAATLSGTYSFYLNPDNTAPLSSVAGCTFYIGNDRLGVEDGSAELAAVCFILSREGSHLRSTSYWITTYVYDEWFADVPESEAIPTYRKASASRSSDWPVDPDATVPVGTVRATTNAGGSVVLSNLRVDGGYLVASASSVTGGEALGEVYFTSTVPQSWLYNRWLTSMSSSGTTAPEGINAAETISVNNSKTATAAQQAVNNWLIESGVPSKFLYLGDIA